MNEHSLEATRQWLAGRSGKLDVLQGCCLGVSKEVERWPE